MEPALEKFRERTFPESDRQLMTRAMDLKNGAIRANAGYWFEHELRQYPAIDLDLDALKAHADRILPGAGRESRGYPCYEVNTQLSEKLGRDLLEPPTPVMWPGPPSLDASLSRLLRGHDGAEGVMLYRSQQKFNTPQVRPPLITIDCRVLHYVTIPEKADCDSSERAHFGSVGRTLIPND